MADQSPTPPLFDVTEEECFQNFKRFLTEEKTELKIFYKTDEDLRKKCGTAKTMVEELRNRNCKKEVALQLSVLILYDLVMLIDDSVSMKTEQKGERIETLKRTVQEITSVYDLANGDGITSIKFLNAKGGIKKVKSTNWKKHFKDREYKSVTRIGSALSTKVLDRFVWAEKMTKPLLVMTITDGVVEGEREGLLKDVIKKCMEKLTNDIERGEHAVAFHFSRVGNDKEAQKFLEDLDNSPTIGKFIDILPATARLEKLADKREKYRWVVLPKLLLGAIMAEWDTRDIEVEVDSASESDHNKNEDGSEDEDAGSDDSDA